METNNFYPLCLSVGVRNDLVCTIITLYAQQKKFLTPAIPSPSSPKEKKKSWH